MTTRSTAQYFLLASVCFCGVLVILLAVSLTGMVISRVTDYTDQLNRLFHQ